MQTAVAPFITGAMAAIWLSAAAAQPSGPTLPAPTVRESGTPARCDWTQIAISSDGDYVGGFGAAPSFASSQYRPLEIEVCAVAWAENQIFDCFIIDSLRRPVRIGFESGAFRVSFSDGSVARVAPDSGALQFDPEARSQPISTRSDDLPFDASAPVDVFVEPSGTTWSRDQLGLGEWIGRRPNGAPLAAGMGVLRIDETGASEVLAIHDGLNDQSFLTRLRSQPEAAMDWIDGRAALQSGLIRAASVSATGRFAVIAETSPNQNILRVYDTETESGAAALCASPEPLETEFSVTALNLGDERTPLRALELAPAARSGTVAVFSGGPRSAAFQTDVQGWLRPFLDAGYAVLLVEYSGSRSPVLPVNERLRQEGLDALRRDWRAVDRYLLEHRACDRNVLAGVSFGAVFFQLAAEDSDACLGGALLAAPWLRYKEPEALFGSRLFGNTSRESSITWEAEAIGPSLHDPESEWRVLQDINRDSCSFEGSIFAIFPLRDEIGVPEDLGACLNRGAVEIAIRDTPYDRHDLVLSDGGPLYARAVTFFAGPTGTSD